MSQRLENVIIEQQSFEVLIPHYDREDAFFYGDPPYFDSEYVYDAEDDSVLVRREALRGKEKIPPGSGRDASLIAFLESLDEKQRYSALIHLSVLWAQSHDKLKGREPG